MRVLITGGTSLLGKALTETKPAQVELESTWFSNYVGVPMYQLDVCDKSAVWYLFDRIKPAAVIHCAAIGSVDFAETNFSEVQQVNVVGTANVTEVARRIGARMVYISTNAVFNGENPPYSEISERQPVNRYGSIKREAEDAVMASHNWVIIRPFLLFGHPYQRARQNWVTTVLTNLGRGQMVEMVNDVYWQPTPARDCARAIWQLIDRPEVNQIYHVAGDERVTLYEFGRAVARNWDFPESMILPVPSSRFPGIAPRPKDTAYDLSKIHGLGIQIQTIEEGLREMK